MLSSIYKSAILIQGPNSDKKEFLHYFTFLTTRIKDNFIIGDSESSIMDASGNGEFRDGMQKISQINTFTNKNEKTIIIVNAHGGINEEGHHVLQLGMNNLPYRSEALFQNLTNAIDKPVDIIFTACHGRCALKDIGALPLGSRIVMFSDEDQATFSVNLLNLINGQFSLDTIFSLDALYDNYLFQLSAKERPILVEIGGNMIDPNTSSEKYLGKQLNNLAKEYAINKLISFCNKDEKCVLAVKIIFNKLEQANSLDDLFLKQNTYLQVIMDIADYEYSYLNSTTFKYFHNLKQTPAFRSASKITIDEMLAQQKIPLSLDMEKLGEVDDDDLEQISSTDMTLQYWEKHGNDYSMYQSLLMFGFRPSNNFPSPEKPDYGPALLAIKYLDEYCSQHDCLVNNLTASESCIVSSASFL